VVLSAEDSQDIIEHVMGDLNQGRTNPEHQAATAPRKFGVVACNFNSNYSWFIYVSVILKSQECYTCH
jgi:hypothetical protein